MIVVQVGQCGNQIGHQLWSKTLEADSNLTAPWFDEESGKARAILIDTEPKVVRRVCSLSRSRGRARADGSDTYQPGPSLVPHASVFRPSNVVYQQSGRGNNWAMGYFGVPGCLEGGQDDHFSDISLAGRTLEILRKEAERLDMFEGCILTHSLSGGTGSGLGSRILENIKEAYPRQHIISPVVQPFAVGDLPLQHYNSILALSTLQRYSDAIVMFNNDEVMLALSGKRVRDRAPVDLDQMNSYIGDCLLDIITPTNPLTYSTKYHDNNGLKSKSLGLGRPPIKYRSFEAFDLVSSVCPMPSNKFMEIWTSSGLPYWKGLSKLEAKTVSWGKLVEIMSAAVPRFQLDPSTHTNPNSRLPGNSAAEIAHRSKTLACQVICRGDDDGQLAEPGYLNRTVSKLVSQNFPPCEWNPYPYDYRITPEKCLQGGRSVTVASNRPRIANHLQTVLEKAKNMYNSRAYMHWFEKYGCDDERFEASFEIVQSVIDSYQYMAGTS